MSAFLVCWDADGENDRSRPVSSPAGRSAVNGALGAGSYLTDTVDLRARPMRRVSMSTSRRRQCDMAVERQTHSCEVVEPSLQPNEDRAADPMTQPLPDRRRPLPPIHHHRNFAHERTLLAALARPPPFSRGALCRIRRSVQARRGRDRRRRRSSLAFRLRASHPPG